MDITLAIIGGILVIAGLAGCVIPLLIGPPLSYAGILLLHFSKYGNFSIILLVVLGVLTAASSVLDNVFPAISARQFGGGSRAAAGSLIGMIAGIFILPPFGIIIGAFTGALIGELSLGRRVLPALKASFGVFLGFIAGVIFKAATCGVMIFYYIAQLIKTVKG